MYRFCFLIVLIFISIFFFPSIAHGQGPHSINVNDQGFEPQEITVKEGEEITFNNTGKNDHWPASNIHPTHDIYPEFDSKKPVPAGQSWTFKFTKAGQWRFHDHLQPNKGGVVKVEALNPSLVKSGTSEDKSTLKDTFLNFYYRVKARLTAMYLKVFPDERKELFEVKNIHNLVKEKNERELTLLIKVYGPEELFKKLDDESGNGSKFTCHGDAHVIGKLSYLTLKGDAVGKNIFSCQGGYLHGVMGELIKEKQGIELAKVIEETCKPLGTKYQRDTCFHGGGHGILAYLNYDLPSAVALCKTLDNDSYKVDCYTGTFMENIMAKKGEGISGMHDTAWLNDTPVFPCNQMDKDPLIQATCYIQQPIWIRKISNQDDTKIISSCAQVDSQYRAYCYAGVAKNAVLAGQYRNPRLISLCGRIPDVNDQYTSCMKSAVHSLVDYYGRELGNKLGLNFCSLVPVSRRQLCQTSLVAKVEGKSREIGVAGVEFVNSEMNITPLQPEKEKTRASFLSALRSNLGMIRTQFTQLYYQVFRTKYNQNLNETNVHQIVNQSSGKELTLLLKLYSAETLISKLKVESNDTKKFSCHTDAHRIGRVSYSLFGKEALYKVDYECQSGYIHGAMAAFIADKGADNLVEEVSAVCNEASSSFAQYACFHGAGHGLLAFFNYDLPQTLANCKQFDSTSSKDACYGGAFMENNFASSDKGGIFGVHNSQWVSNDPLYPCNKIDNDSAIQQACYIMQSERMYLLEGSNVNKLIDQCHRVPGDNSQFCFFGMGRLVMTNNHFDSAKAIARCNKIQNESNNYRRCVDGALFSLMDYFGDKLGQRGVDYCNQLPNQYQTECKKILNARVTDVTSSV